MRSSSSRICAGAVSYVTPMVIFTRRLGMRDQLLTVALLILPLGTVSSVFPKVRILVERKPISSTVPSTSLPMEIQSPTL